MGEVRGDMVTTVERSMRAAQNANLAELRPALAAGRTVPDAAALAAFGEELTRRYGAFQSLSIVAETPGGSFARPTQTAAIVFTFERRELTGSATFVLLPDPGKFVPRATLDELIIDDDMNGPLVLP
jgi:hypothetical protein